MALSPYTQIFEASVLNVLPTMTMTSVSRCGDCVVKDGNLVTGIVSGIIGMAGPKHHASMTLSFEREAILGIFATMLGEHVETINDEILDAVGEFTNIICGDVKRRLSEAGTIIEMATPLVVFGADVRIRDRVTKPTTVIPFETPSGKFFVETNLGV
ncbi:MAG: chemotaxis protein CheX [Oligoflexia bacterium]|nr:chemotaxis protein CheX [Oligoflexia bacterium]